MKWFLNPLGWLGIATLSGAITPPKEMDCGAIAKYFSQIYQGNDQVVYNGDVYKAKWYADKAHGPDKDKSVWDKIGTCTKGTENGRMYDCGFAHPWVPGGVYNNNPTAHVHYKEELYDQQIYDDGKVKSSPDPALWKKKGPCLAGTAGEGADNFVDCSSIHGWSGAVTYNGTPKRSVHYNGYLWRQLWWTEGSRPGQPKGKDSDPWEKVGKCKKGTDTLAGEKSGYEMTGEKKKLFCSCCKTCGRLEPNFQPKCMDTVTKREDCWFNWCKDENAYDKAKCEEVLKSQVLNQYDGDTGRGKTKWPSPVYAPFMDAGLYPALNLADVASKSGVKHFVIAFVQSEKNGQGKCMGTFPGDTPTTVGPIMWDKQKMGNTYFFDFVKALRDIGGDIGLSFGGALGVELADSKGCQGGSYEQSVRNLFNAYAEPVRFLKLTRIDFDIEGGAVGSVNRQTGWRYRFEAVKQLQKEFPNLNITWTLPVLPTGLTLDGMNFITDLVNSDAPIANLNLMTMDYGDNFSIDVQEGGASKKVNCNNNMGLCELAAVTTTAEQFFNAVQSAGKQDKFNFHKLDDVYPMMGVTPMLGLNDVTVEVYTLEDAKHNVEVYKNKRIGFLSNWSLHRDAPCKGPTKVVDTTCSSLPTQTKRFEFASIFKTIMDPEGETETHGDSTPTTHPDTSVNRPPIVDHPTINRPPVVVNPPEHPIKKHPTDLDEIKPPHNITTEHTKPHPAHIPSDHIRTQVEIHQATIVNATIAGNFVIGVLQDGEIADTATL